MASESISRNAAHTGTQSVRQKSTLTPISRRPQIRDDRHSLPIALLRAREAVMAHFRPHHRKGGITEQQWRVIRTLHLYGEMDATRLAGQSFLLAPSLSRILRDLEKGGYVRRRLSADDSRQSLLCLSPKATTMVNRVAPFLDGIQRNIARRFGTDRYHALLALLHELEVALHPRTQDARRKSTSSPSL